MNDLERSLDNDRYDQSQNPRMKLDAKGHCCGRCQREFDPKTGLQSENWAWMRFDGMWIKRSSVETVKTHPLPPTLAP
jgi:hypothetical protein